MHDSSSDDYCFWLQKFPQPVNAAFSTNTRLLKASERRQRVMVQGVDKHASRLRLLLRLQRQSRLPLRQRLQQNQPIPIRTKNRTAMGKTIGPVRPDPVHRIRCVNGKIQTWVIVAMRRARLRRDQFKPGPI